MDIAQKFAATEKSKTGQSVEELHVDLTTIGFTRDESQARLFSKLVESEKIFDELMRAHVALQSIPTCITVFGSARFKPDNKYYQAACEIGKAISEHGYGVMTGGGPGIMEAANKGAQEAGGYSVGCNIILPKEQKANSYTDKLIEIDDFMVRESMLRHYSDGFIIMPGGIGTLQEVFDNWVLIKTGKAKDCPLVFFGKEYWSPLIDFMRESLLASGAIDAADLKSIHLTDSVTEAVKIACDHN